MTTQQDFNAYSSLLSSYVTSIAKSGSPGAWGGR